MLSILLGRLVKFQSNNSDITEERMEEYKMLSGFKNKEICRIRNLFIKLTEGSDNISKDVFLKIEVMAMNPLKDRIALCFGFDTGKESLNFEEFLCGLALFNSPGMREQKLRLAFRIQDFDGDGVIGKADLLAYTKLITANTMSDKEIDNLVAEVLQETASDARQEHINFSDFQRVVAPSDFQAKLQLPI